MSRQPPNIDTILVTAIEIAAADRRAAYLDSVCSGDAPLRARVERLLRAHYRAGNFLEQPVGGDRPTEFLEALLDTERVPGAEALESDDIQLDFLQPCDDPGCLGTLGPYEVLEVIGHGGMGVVLRAHDPYLDRMVAIKALAPAFAAHPTGRKRFLREARAAAAVSHPHVVTIHAVDEANHTPYLVMECIQGQSLQDRIDRVGTLPLNEVLRIGMQVAEGLAAAHEHGLIHRDIKPSNVLLEQPAQRAKITDFGLARAVDDVGISHAGDVAGTPEFMSPEQAQGSSVDHRSDLFSLGTLLSTMCTGRSPFRADTTLAVLRRVCDDVPPPVRELNPEIPEDLSAIISRLLAKVPDERYQTAEEVAVLLGQQLARLQPATVTSPGDSTDSASEIREGTAPADVPMRLRSSRFSRRLWAFALLGLLALLASVVASEAAGTSRFLAAVMEMAKGSGTLIVANDDPAVLVHIPDRNLIISGVPPTPVLLPSGQYRLKATRHGLPVSLDRDVVTIGRGGREVVRIVGVPPASDATTTGAMAEPSDAAAWEKILASDAPPPAVVPFDARAARQSQQAWADYLGLPLRREVSLREGITLTLVLIPPGEFLMGAPQDEIDRLVKSRGDESPWRKGFPREGPQHLVRITRAFYLGEFEVTQQQYECLMNENPSRFVRGEYGDSPLSGQPTDQLPVDNTTWFDAVHFCNEVSRLENRDAYYALQGEAVSRIAGTGYRLPTEAEWEYACRAGSAERYHFGSSLPDLSDHAWYRDNSKGTTHPVGKKLPNNFGLFDMHGNIWEWCQDGWDSTHYSHSPIDDPEIRSGDGTYVYRGGGFFFPAALSRATCRAAHEPQYHSSSIGFRVAASVASAQRP
ncbi:MAG: bifunctional serine/threonine-protein kinase/formylglycine-generating enzyme family protein [Pirellulaceae bacterium]|nr:bifunctional serine/threonine-protein kinase/formylglycine-generating enzyme family protein [Pirellulaceae bacterium]